MSEAYAVYHVATGQLLRSGLCQEGMADHQAGDGEAVIKLDEPIDPNAFRVVAGALVQTS